MSKSKSPKEISLGINRRRFIYYSALAASATALTGSVSSRPRIKSANGKLNIGCIGVGGKGASDIQGVTSENIVALCDVDSNTLNSAAKKYEGAKLYRDYRRMFDEQKNLDAVVISTPDHQHFLPAMMAIERRQHVYCQKPLTHTIWEARELTKAAKKISGCDSNGKPGPLPQWKSRIVRNHLERRDWRCLRSA